MWTYGWRDQIWNQLQDSWDVIIVGGGITGAGILREAVRAGLKVLLLEQHDFSSGTSSRSSKLVHGGLRYLQNAQIRLTLVSVRERENLLKQGRGLVSPLGFLIASMKQDPMPEWLFGVGLAIYDLLALKWSHRHYDADSLRALCPPLSNPNLTGGYRYIDAQTDDARLVLRLIREAVREGGCALNYAQVESLLRGHDGRVRGVQVRDTAYNGQDRSIEVNADVVINATGAWADDLRRLASPRRHIRKLRGSHLVLPSERLPLVRAVNILHPFDGRPVFALPWEGATLIGTTDVDHAQPLQTDPAISYEEARYLLDAAQYAFPDLSLSGKDILSTFSGVRAVVDTGKSNPSKESREHVLWLEKGLLTVSGGKLTTFRLMAHSALRAIRHALPTHPRLNRTQRVLKPPSELPPEFVNIDPTIALRLSGRYGEEGLDLLRGKIGDLDRIPGTPSIWAELTLAAQAEGVVHLDDLLLRRLRLGLLLPRGGAEVMDDIRSRIQHILHWDDSRWEDEVNNYHRLWDSCYYLPASFD